MGTREIKLSGDNNLFTIVDEAATEYYGTMAYLNVIDPNNKK